MKSSEKAPDLLNETFAEVVVTDQEHKDRLDRYSRAKEHQKTVVEYIQQFPELSKEYDAMSGCGEILIFQRWIQTNFRKLAGGFSCKKHLLCKPCAIRRDSRQIRDYSLKIQYILSEHPNWTPVLITRTVANGLDLLERFNHLGGTHKILMQCRRDSLKKNTTARGRSVNSVMQYVHGSVGTYEFKRGKESGQWHPHIHEVAFLDPVFEFTPEYELGWHRADGGTFERVKRLINVPLEFRSRLAQEYWMISGDSYIVDVRRIEIFDLSSFTEGVELPAQEISSDQQKVAKALCEVFKYALKFSDMPLEDQIHAYKILRGRRLIFSYGCLRGVKVPDNLVDQSRSELEIGPYVYELYKFANNEYYLSKYLDNQEFEELQEDTSMKGRMENLRRREGNLESFDNSVLLETGFRINKEVIDNHLLNSKHVLEEPF
jgi:hypothetical protein